MADVCAALTAPTNGAIYCSPDDYETFATEAKCIIVCNNGYQVCTLYTIDW